MPIKRCKLTSKSNIWIPLCVDELLDGKLLVLISFLLLQVCRDLKTFYETLQITLQLME